MGKRIYENAISRWPEDDRPREKLIQRGPEALSNAELLAILLRVGVKGHSAVDLARYLLQEIGGLRALALWDAEELCRLHGLSIAKVAQLKAAIELGRRILQEEKRTFGQVYSSQQVFDYLLPTMRDLKQEVFKAVFLNARNQIIDEAVLSRGTVTNSAVYPREVFSLASRVGAAAVIFAHNHPSGSISPSKEDYKITLELVVASEMLQITVLDHLIIGENRYYSFADEGVLAHQKEKLHQFLFGQGW